MRRVIRPVALAAALLATACVMPGPGLTPYGRMATVYPTKGSVALQGELLAATSDSVWLRVTGGNVYSRATRDLQQVNVERHRAGGKRSYQLLALGGAATGLGMTIACSSYESSGDGSGDSGGCIGLVPVFMLLFVGVGSVFALTNYVSATTTFLPTDARLRNFARFPQGLPDTVRHLRYIPAPPLR